MIAYAGSYGWTLEWATRDDLTDATAAEFIVHASAQGAREPRPSLPAAIVPSGVSWTLTHRVAQGTFAPGSYTIQPAVAFGPTVRLLAHPQVLTVQA